ncbi:MAG: altronate dehydratase family protein [Clostridiales bacterium]|nr:altronate dehydratase family protein [Clostridiales bacterium]
MNSQYLHINKADNVAVVTDDSGLPEGYVINVDGHEIHTAQFIKRGHKVALTDIANGEPVIKYGFPIGVAKTDIKAGDWIHSHNMTTSLGDDLTYTYTPNLSPLHAYDDTPMVNGFMRRNGQMGIRNEFWIIPTVGCVNGQANAIAERLRSEGTWEGVDDIRSFPHNYGCSQLGQDHANTRAALAALATHPNAGGVLVLGLGCENNRLDQLRAAMGNYDPQRTAFLTAQEVNDEIEEGVRLARAILKKMAGDHRAPISISNLKVGLKCGGSDGLSGITANPLVGRFSDWLVAHGGTTVLTEVPEMFGAETILMNRAVNHNVFEKEVSLINNFKQYFRDSNQPIYENPSPGNKDGGITTLEEKSLGCVQKGGNAPVVDVLSYTEPIQAHGLNLLQAPGNDLVAATALALSGCQLILFTTGRGTPFGTFVPTLKISTNTALATKKSNWIDFNAGSLIEGSSMDTLLTDLIQKVIDISNGTPSQNEISQSKDIAIFKTGVTL